MKRVLSILLLISIFLVGAFAKISNPTFTSNEGGVEFIHLTSTITYRVNFSEESSNITIKTTDSDSSVLIMNYVTGEVIGSTNMAEPLNEFYIENLAKGEYSLLFSGNGDFSIFANGIDLRDKLTLEVAFDSYEFKIDKAHTNIVISEVDSSAFLSLSSTTSSNIYYQSMQEPFNTLNIASLEIGTYQLNVTITPNTNNTIIDEPTIISADESFKVSNPIIKSNEGDIALIYTGYSKDYQLFLNGQVENLTIRKTTKDCGINIWSLPDNKMVIDGCASGVDGEVNIASLPAGEYMIQLFNGDLDVIKSPLNGDLMQYTNVVMQSDHYEFITSSDLTDVYIEEQSENSNIFLFSIEDGTTHFESKEPFLNIDRLISGRYQINVNINYFVEPIIDDSQKFSNISVDSNEGVIEYKYNGFTKEYLLVAEEEINNFAIIQNSDNCSLEIIDNITGEKIEDTCSSKPQNEINIPLLKRGLYRILTPNDDFGITSNGTNIKNKLLFVAQNDSYSIFLNEPRSNIIINEANKETNLNLHSTFDNTFYETKEEPRNTLIIDKLIEGEYIISVHLELMDLEPYIIKFSTFDDKQKLSNPTIIGDNEGVKPYYQGYAKRYTFTLNEAIANFKISVENGSATLREITTGKEIHSFESEPFNEISVALLPKSDYEVIINDSENFKIGNALNDLKEKLTLKEQIDNYKLILEKSYKSISIKEPNTLANMVLMRKDILHESKNNSLEVSNLESGIYDLNINIPLEEAKEPTIDKTQKFSNPKLTTSKSEIELTYSGFTREYILTLKEAQNHLVISKEGDCGIFYKRVEDEKFKGICGNSITNTLKLDNELRAGEYDIHIVGNEEFEIYSDSGDLRDSLKFVGKSDSYIFNLDSVVTDVELIDLNESVEVSINSKFITYSNDKAPYNNLKLLGLSAGEYEVNIHASLIDEPKNEIKAIDEKYKFSNLKILAGFDKLELIYTNFSRHYFLTTTNDYSNVVITKDGEGCGVVIRNLSNGGEVIKSCSKEIQNKLSIDLLKKGDYVITIIGSESFSISSNEGDLKELLKFSGKSDSYTLVLDSSKRDILITDTNESSKIEIFDKKNEDFRYSKKEYPFNFMSLPYLKAGTYGITITALIVADTTIKRPDSAEVIADENKTEVKLKPIELVTGYISNIKTVVDNKGKVEAVIKISDKAEKIIKQTILRAPKGSEVEMDEVGNLKQIITTTKAKAEILAKSSGQIEAKIDINDDESLKREFIVPAGSETEIKEDGTTTATNELEGDKGNYETNVEITADGEVSATAFLYEESSKRAKISTGLLTASYSARRDFSSVKVEFIWDEVEERKLRKITSGLLKATYTTRREFSFDGEESYYRAIDASSATNIIITPSPEATFEENQYFLGENEGYRTIKLTEGEANISIDGESSTMGEDEYILPEVDGKELYLYEGWNLISTPIDVTVSGDVTSEDVNYTLDSFGSYVELWKFNNNSWEKNPDLVNSGDGFWIYLNAESASLFVGSGYDVNLSNLNDGWHLFGAGKDLQNLKEEYGFKQVYKFSREDNNSNWIENPTTIYRGEGFWIESEYVPSLKEESLRVSKGWNLISIPIDEDVELSEFNYEEIWSYETSGLKAIWQTPTKLSSKKAYWIKSDSDSELKFNGYGYKPDFSNLSSGWSLLGTGEDLIDIKEFYEFESILKYDNGWIENPNVIYAGEGFWVNKN